MSIMFQINQWITKRAFVAFDTEIIETILCGQLNGKILFFSCLFKKKKENAMAESVKNQQFKTWQNTQTQFYNNNISVNFCDFFLNLNFVYTRFHIKFNFCYNFLCLDRH